jgi:hypothetical protein
MRFSSLFLFILVTSNVFCQDTFISIRGTLVDSKSKESIPFASIYIKGKSIGTTTNDEGRFLFHVPSAYSHETLVISVIGYTNFESTVSQMTDKENNIELKQNIIVLNEVTVNASKKELTARDIVKKAVARIPENYPMTPFRIEGFFRDLQKENDKPVALLEAAIRLHYKDYNPGYEEVEIMEVRKSFNKRHPVNGTYDRQNSIFDLMEDNYVKHRFGPMDVKGWKFSIDNILTYNNRIVYKVSGIKSRFVSCIMWIDTEDFAILRLEYREQMVNGVFSRRYLNLPDPYGQQQTSFLMIFEFQEIDDKLYLKYQREEDAYNLFNKTTNETILKQSYLKELFVNNAVQGVAEQSTGQRMNINKSVEQQATSYNAEFWKNYNAPMETSKDSKIVKELQSLELKKD